MSGIEKVNHCPGCGAALDTGDGSAVVPMDSSDEPYNPTFDCYCKACGWSGDISPDLPLGPEPRLPFAEALARVLSRDADIISALRTR